MKDYFILQSRRFSRKLRDAGIPVWPGYILLAIVFLGFSFFLFYKTEYAAYIYAAVSLTLIGKLSEVRRNEFLTICYGDRNVRQLRIAENLLIALPFLCFLWYKAAWLMSVVLLLLAVLFALINFRTVVHIRIPTPFYARPFEFATGFRNTYYVIIAAYALTIIAVTVPNFNLGIFAMLVIFGTSLTYYLRPEHPYYVWIYGMNARSFIIEKIKTALLYAGAMVMPVVVLLIAGFPSYIGLVLGFFLLGLAYVVCMIVSKYAAYPDELNLSQSIMLALCIWLPPLLLIMIPYLFRKSTRRLSQLLP